MELDDTVYVNDDNPQENDSTESAVELEPDRSENGYNGYLQGLNRVLCGFMPDILQGDSENSDDSDAENPNNQRGERPGWRFGGGRPFGGFRRSEKPIRLCHHENGIFGLNAHVEKMTDSDIKKWLELADGEESTFIDFFGFVHVSFRGKHFTFPPKMLDYLDHFCNLVMPVAQKFSGDFEMVEIYDPDLKLLLFSEIEKLEELYVTDMLKVFTSVLQVFLQAESHDEVGFIQYRFDFTRYFPGYMYRNTYNGTCDSNYLLVLGSI